MPLREVRDLPILHVLPLQRANYCLSSVCLILPQVISLAVEAQLCLLSLKLPFKSSAMQSLAGQLLPRIWSLCLLHWSTGNTEKMFASSKPLLESLCRALSCAFRKTHLCVSTFPSCRYFYTEPFYMARLPQEDGRHAARPSERHKVASVRELILHEHTGSEQENHGKFKGHTCTTAQRPHRRSSRRSAAGVCACPECLLSTCTPISNL